LYEHLRNVSRTFHYYQLYVAANDSLLNQTVNNKIINLSMEYEQEKNQREIELVQQEATIQHLSLQNKTYMLIVSIAILVFFSGGIVIRSVMVQRRHRELEQKKSALEELNKELNDKIAQIHVLSGLLPICADCKSIRNDKGYWEQVEGYLTQHSDVKFSHGFCPQCTKELFPDGESNTGASNA
jgi:hypothetical protein